MRQLSSFNFRIRWRWWVHDADNNFTIDIQTFQNNNWLRFGPTVCWQDADGSDIVLYNLPYKFCCFEIMSNDLNLLYTESKRSPTVFEHVRTIWLTNPTPQWSMQTFNFIQNSFPNVRTLYFHGERSKYDYKAMELFKKQLAKLFDDDFLNNSQIQLSTVTTVYLDIERELFTNAAFQCLFKLLPNLKVIKTNNLENAREYIGRHYDDTVKNTLDCLKIEPINIPEDIRNSIVKTILFQNNGFHIPE